MPATLFAAFVQNLPLTLQERLKSRLATADELDYYKNGGILHRVLCSFMKAA